MPDLASQTCEACRADAIKLSPDEIQAYLNDVHHWHVDVIEGVPQLVKVFTFKNYVQACEFSNKLCALAEQSDHHPSALIEWGKVTVRWWSHKIKGLHRNDFIMAAKTDLL